MAEVAVFALGMVVGGSLSVLIFACIVAGARADANGCQR